MAAGLEFEVDEYLRSSPFTAVSVFRKGAVPPKGNPDRERRPDSGFLVVVSEDESPRLVQQVADALVFLAEHEGEFEKLRAAGVDNLLFDFGAQQEHVLQRAQYLPPELIQAMAEQQMGLVVSVIQMPAG